MITLNPDEIKSVGGGEYHDARIFCCLIGSVMLITGVILWVVPDNNASVKISGYILAPLGLGFVLGGSGNVYPEILCFEFA